MVRRAFQISETDRDFLDLAYPSWEAILEGQSQWVILDPFEVPTGFTQQNVAVALRIAPTYPDTEIDMAYFKPSLARTDGKTIEALSTLQMDGQAWQQWSRHRLSGEWRPGFDSIETHLLFVRSFLELELKK